MDAIIISQSNIRSAIWGMRCKFFINPTKILSKCTPISRLDGRIIPRWFRPEDEEKVIIDRVTDVRRAASLKAGGCGIRYPCLVKGREIGLFHEEDVWHQEV